MPRLFVPGARVEDGHLVIRGPELRHLRVLRANVGEPVVVFDAGGREYEAVIETITTSTARARIVAERTTVRESPLDLVLAPGLLKGDKLDLVVEKATELGVARVAPVVCRHSVGRAQHLDRWRRIAVAAAKQSGRTRVPIVDPPVPLAQAIAAPWPGLRLLAWEGEPRGPIPPAAAAAVVVLVGPEGGFAQDEVDEARAAGFAAFGLGPRVLRAETAAIVAAALCQHRFGDG